MPTGYTAKIKDGISFNDFVWGCARAFGAFVAMRDEPSDTPIPERFEPSDYHIKECDKIWVEFKKISSMTVEKATVEAQNEYEKETERINKSLDETNATIQKYWDMLVKVRAWHPPTPDHIELKNFMIQQITSSIKHDDMSDYYINHPSKLLTGE